MLSLASRIACPHHPHLVPNFSSQHVLQTSTTPRDALHLAVTATEGAAQPVKAGVAHVALRGGLSPLSQNAPVQNPKGLEEMTWF